MATKENILVSIIIPVYNVEQYLEECLNSVLKQDFADYEIICVNDGSTDHSIDILRRYEVKHPCIRIIEHSENKGLSAARNTGMKYANGKYILFVDSDDMVEPNILDDLYAISESNELDILYFQKTNLYDGIQKYKKQEKRDCEVLDKSGVLTGRELFCVLIEKEMYIIGVWMQMFRRDFLCKNHIEFWDKILHEDVDFSFRCAMQAERVMYIDKTCYVYRQRGNSIMHMYSADRAQSFFVILISIFTYWNTHTFSKRENDAIAEYFREIYRRYQEASAFSPKNTEMSYGTDAEKALYRIICGKKENRWLTLTDEQIEEIKGAQNVIVYGAGKAAGEIISLLKDHNIRIDAIAVENEKENPEYLYGIKIQNYKKLEEYKDKSIVVIGISARYSHGIYEQLKEFGFSNIMIGKDLQKKDTTK